MHIIFCSYILPFNHQDFLTSFSTDVFGIFRCLFSLLGEYSQSLLLGPISPSSIECEAHQIRSSLLLRDGLTCNPPIQPSCISSALRTAFIHVPSWLLSFWTEHARWYPSTVSVLPFSVLPFSVFARLSKTPLPPTMTLIS